MAAGVTWKCNVCGYEVALHLFQEYYIDPTGARQLYGHPLETCQEALACGIKGFSSIVYCPTCKGTKDVVDVEFDTARRNEFHSTVSVWAETENLDNKKHQGVCGECGGDLTSELEGKRCPNCGVGKFVPLRRWYS